MQCLKAYALEKLGLFQEAEATANQAAAQKPTDEGSLQPLVMVYRALGRRMLFSKLMHTILIC